MLRSEKNESHGRGRDFLKKATKNVKKALQKPERTKTPKGAQTRLRLFLIAFDA